MTSPKKLEANRRNALKSTGGPKTPAGKARSSTNGIEVRPLLPDARPPWLRADEVRYSTIEDLRGVLA
jgi:hypothetical protein